MVRLTTLAHNINLVTRLPRPTRTHRLTKKIYSGVRAEGTHLCPLVVCCLCVCGVMVYFVAFVCGCVVCMGCWKLNDECRGAARCRLSERNITLPAVWSFGRWLFSLTCVKTISYRYYYELFFFLVHLFISTFVMRSFLFVSIYFSLLSFLSLSLPKWIARFFRLHSAPRRFVSSSLSRTRKGNNVSNTFWQPVFYCREMKSNRVRCAVDILRSAPGRCHWHTLSCLLLYQRLPTWLKCCWCGAGFLEWFVMYKGRM